MPHYIWKNIEDGKVSLISAGIRGMFALPPKERMSRQKRLVNYILESLRTHNGYSFGYFLCEILNLVNVIANILFIDVSFQVNIWMYFSDKNNNKKCNRYNNWFSHLQKFLGGTFLTYGTDVMKFSNVSNIEFDRMLKITFFQMSIWWKIVIFIFESTDESRKPQRSHGWSVPSNHKMYIPQIRSVGKYSEAWCPVRSGFEHFEWENLHFLVVLVPNSGAFICLRHYLLGFGCYVANNPWSHHQASLPQRNNKWSWGSHQQYSGKNWPICEFKAIFNRNRLEFRKFINEMKLMATFFGVFQVGDFLLLHLLGQNISVNAFSDILRELCNRLSSSTPSAPSPMEMAPFYSSNLENEKETMT